MTNSLKYTLYQLYRFYQLTSPNISTNHNLAKYLVNEHNCKPNIGLSIWYTQKNIYKMNKILHCKNFVKILVLKKKKKWQYNVVSAVADLPSKY